MKHKEVGIYVYYLCIFNGFWLHLGSITVTSVISNRAHVTYYLFYVQKFSYLIMVFNLLFESACPDSEPVLFRPILRFRLLK